MNRLQQAGRNEETASVTGAGSTDAAPAARSAEKRKLVIGISSRTLFDLDASHRIYERDGLQAYREYQIENEDEPLPPGSAFHLVRKLLRLNEILQRPGRIEVILLSRNSADTGLRIFNSIEHHGLQISRAAFCGGRSAHRYVAAFGAHLFLSNASEDVRQALERGVAAATLMSSTNQPAGSGEIRFAFDGDSVLFSDQSERIYREQGLPAFDRNECSASEEPLDGGPFKSFLEELHCLQQEFGREKCPIRTALFTARAAPAHKRVIKTLRYWNIHLDEALFLGGQDKIEFLKSYGADIFFDDQQTHCEKARHDVTTGHVPHGVANLAEKAEPPDDERHDPQTSYSR